MKISCNYIGLKVMLKASTFISVLVFPGEKFRTFIQGYEYKIREFSFRFVANKYIRLMYEII